MHHQIRSMKEEATKEISAELVISLHFSAALQDWSNFVCFRESLRLRFCREAELRDLPSSALESLVTVVYSLSLHHAEATHFTDSSGLL